MSVELPVYRNGKQDGWVKLDIDHTDLVHGEKLTGKSAHIYWKPMRGFVVEYDDEVS